jgi:calcineurin-like phosphoesterase family protein
MKTWLTADWHLGEDRFELMGRPFTTRDEHIETLIQNHNALVAPTDRVIMVGDVCYQKTPEFLPLVARFNGVKTLIRGNHDRVFTDEQLAPYFDTVVEEGKGINVDVDGIPCYVTHYPTEGVFDRFNLVGHIHAAWKYQLNMFNVGVDVNSYRPVALDRIRFHFDAICKFYDKDVWVAYSDINSDHAGFRGKQNTYFRP